MIGLSSPPAEPGGGVIWVNTASESPLKPFHNSTAKNKHQPAQAERRRGKGQPHRDDVAAAALGVERGRGA